jgi:hypothetical protein
MLYLLDANVLIDANRDYYPLDRVPEFWEWVAYNADQDRIRIPSEVLSEIMAGKADPLTDWIDAHPQLCLDEEPDPAKIAEVVRRGYATDLTDEEVEKIGNDPFLIACAWVPGKDRCVVTTEVSRPAKQRANRKVPDVCADFGIRCRNTFQLTRELDFSTNWRLNM